MRNISLAKKRKDCEWIVSLSRMLIVSMCSYAVGGAFLGMAYFDLYYHLIALTVILRMILETQPLAEDYSMVSEQMRNLRIKHGLGAPASDGGAIARNVRT